MTVTPHILEARELFQEGKFDRTRRAVALLRDDDLRLALVLVGAVVLLLAEDERHDVGVLLNAPALSQVTQLRFVVAT